MTEQTLREFLHFDPITILIVAAGALMTWANMRATTSWHTEWIKKHDEECDKQRKENTKILGDLSVSTAKLTILTEAHEDRLKRIENREDRE